MSERTEIIWARIPEADRELIGKAPPGQRDRWIELWAMAEANVRRQAGQASANAAARERIQDELDELLLQRVSHGEYGAVATKTLHELVRRRGPGTNRREFLRLARKAIREARGHARGKAGE